VVRLFSQIGKSQEHLRIQHLKRRASILMPPTWSMST